MTAGTQGHFPSMRGHQARARQRRTRRAWLALAGALVLIGTAVMAGGVLRRSLVLDLVSIWPGWVVTLAVLIIRHRMGARQRFLGAGFGPALPISLLGWLVVAVSLHLVGWEVLPSSAGRLEGPAVMDRIGTTAIDVRLDGLVIVDSDTGVLYEVSGLASAGAVAPVQGEELLTGDDLEVRLREGPEAGWFGSGGWRLSLHSGIDWAVTVSATEVEAGFRELSLRSLQVEAEGEIRLGPAAGEVPVSLSGDLVVEIPADVSVEVAGPATVGSGWEVTADGRSYRGEGAGRYLIEVDPDSDVVVNQA